MPTFDSRYGPGSTVRVGRRSFPMPFRTEDKREIELLSKAPGVFVVPEPVVPFTQKSTDALEPAPGEAEEAAKTTKTKHPKEV